MAKFHSICELGLASPEGHFSIDFRCFFYVPVAGEISSSLKYIIDNIRMLDDKYHNPNS